MLRVPYRHMRCGTFLKASVALAVSRWLRKLAPERSEWPILFGVAVQDIMLRIKPEVLDPKLALAMVMESAIAMSKVDLSAL